MKSGVVVDPAEYPVSLSEMRDYLRETELTSQDGVLQSAIAGAVDLFEREVGRKLITQTIEQTFDNFPDAINFDWVPVSSIESIKFDDTDGVEQTLSSSDYKLDNKGSEQWIVPVVGKTWPSTLVSGINTVRVRYIVGFGAATAVPEDIKNWIKAYTADIYQGRSALSDSAQKDHPYFRRIHAAYRIY